ncbi:hypothetical protein [Parashewanella spongiae]|nr:hypothetical protein [Parashewanella spongiae]
MAALFLSGINDDILDGIVVSEDSIEFFSALLVVFYVCIHTRNWQF